MFDYECKHISLISIYYVFGHESISFFGLKEEIETSQGNCDGSSVFLHRKWTQETYLFLHLPKTLFPNNNSIHNLKCIFFSRIFMQDSYKAAYIIFLVFFIHAYVDKQNLFFYFQGKTIAPKENFYIRIPLAFTQVLSPLQQFLDCSYYCTPGYIVT